MRHVVVAAFMLGALGACATPSGGRISARDAFVERAPFYAGQGTLPAELALTPPGIVPITFERGSTRAAFDPPDGDGTPLAALLVQMNAFLDSLPTRAGAPAVKLRGAGGIVAVAPAGIGPAPNVSFGCNAVADYARFDCPNANDTSGVRPALTRLAVTSPSGEWIEWASGTLSNNRLPAFLLLRLELGLYQPRVNPARREKWVELGTDYSVPLPWLTPINEPLTVVQLTGALVGADGSVIRMGAEGLYLAYARRLTGPEIIENNDIRALQTLRRDDLPRRPLVWQVAMREMVQRLTMTERVAQR